MSQSDHLKRMMWATAQKMQRMKLDSYCNWTLFDRSWMSIDEKTEETWAREVLESSFRIQYLLPRRELPIVFDLANVGLQTNARVFASRNGIPLERLNVSVFEKFAIMRSVQDLRRSPFVDDEAKRDVTRTLRTAFDANRNVEWLVRGLIDVLVVRPLSVDSCPTSIDPDTGDIINWIDNVKVRASVALRFAITPGGDLRFLSKLGFRYDMQLFRPQQPSFVPKTDCDARLNFNSAIATDVHECKQPIIYDAVPTMTVEERERVRRRKERAIAERKRRSETLAHATTRVDVPSPVDTTKRRSRGRTSHSYETPTDAQRGKKVDRIQKAREHAEALRQRERERVAELEARFELCRIGDAIQRGD